MEFYAQYKSRPRDNNTRQKMCKERTNKEPIWARAINNLPPRQNMKYKIWKTLNQLKVGVARTKNFVR